MAQANSRGHSTADPKGAPSNFNPHDELKAYAQSSQHGGHSHARGHGTRNQQHQPYGGSSMAVGGPEGNRASAAGNGGHHMDEVSNSRLVHQPTPLFERLVTEEVQELKAYARIIENQNRRLAELERVHGDLESRLELESRRRVQLESTLEEREREWALRFQQLEEDRDHWKDVVSSEQNKNARLIDQVVRKDQDIHRMLQRKYDSQQRESPSSASIRNVRQMVNERQGPNQHSHQEPGQRGDQQFRSPHEILAASGSIEAVRIRNVRNMLSDFFAM